MAMRDGTPGRRRNHPLIHARRMAGARRTRIADRRLATLLATVAGAANAGGAIALGEYASHMTGYLSQTADGIALGRAGLAAQALAAIASFIAGAATSALLINWARLRRPRAVYATPIALQGLLLLCLAAFDLFGASADGAELALLCFVMGLQNATITKISGAVIRTTHATGMVTDLGIELGRAVSRRLLGPGASPPDWGKARLFARILGAFLLGGIAGALGYGAAGVAFSAPLGLALIAVSAPRLGIMRVRSGS